MPLRHLAISAVAVAAAVLAPAASATPGCPLATDPAGDTQAVDPQSAAGDLLAVDVASDESSFTVRVALADLQPAPPVVGHIYEVFLDDGEHGVRFSATVDSGTASYRLAHDGPNPPGSDTAAYRYEPLGPISGRLDPAGKSVTMWAKASAVGFGKGRRLRVAAVTWQSAGNQNVSGLPEPAKDSFVQSSDFLDATATYRTATPGCIRVEH